MSTVEGTARVWGKEKEDEILKSIDLVRKQVGEIAAIHKS